MLNDDCPIYLKCLFVELNGNDWSNKSSIIFSENIASKKTRYYSRVKSTLKKQENILFINKIGRTDSTAPSMENRNKLLLLTSRLFIIANSQFEFILQFEFTGRFYKIHWIGVKCSLSELSVKLELSIHVLMCLFKLADWVKVASQIGQIWLRLPVWIFMWIFRALDWLNVFWHMLHSYGFSPVWIYSCE